MSRPVEGLLIICLVLLLVTSAGTAVINFLEYIEALEASLKEATR